MMATASKSKEGANREALAAFLLRLRSNGITNHDVLSAFEAIPRRNFVPVIHITNAYARGAMPIECGQTMTAADTVAKKLLALRLSKKHRVLELGTGTAYQTALIAHLSNKVLSFERFNTLVEKARIRLENLGIKNVQIELKDALKPDPEIGVFDRIIANASFKEAPKHYLDFMSANAELIAPIGPEDGIQVMTRFTKVGVRFETETLFELRTQPFVSGVAKAI